MANSSIYAAFERMWQHILEKFNNYVSTEDLDNHISNAIQEALDKKADSEALDDHIESETNPHNVTAEQVGAIPVTGGSMESTLTLRGVVLTDGIDYGSGDPSGGVLGQLYFKKVT